jgi:23S rRNA pseudouridine1911/1915/1917 synthase
MSIEFHTHRLTLPAESRGLRLDQALALALPQYSRARLQRWIEAGAVTLAGRVCTRGREKVQGGEELLMHAEAPEQVPMQPESLPLDIVYEDEALLVVNKPVGLVVHPGAGNPSHTLQNALLAHDAALVRVPRAGIVHRLDKDTSGLLVVARTLETQTTLAAALASRDVHREYLALVLGTPTGGATIAQPIGRHRTQRVRMTVRPDGRQAVTHFRLEERFEHHTLLRVKLETGRTHQIRVHLSHAGLPVVGDPVYGGRRRQVLGAGPELKQALQDFKRQALHAAVLGFTHPVSGKPQRFEAPLPQDFAQLLEVLRADEAEQDE